MRVFFESLFWAKEKHVPRKKLIQARQGISTV